MPALVLGILLTLGVLLSAVLPSAAADIAFALGGLCFIASLSFGRSPRALFIAITVASAGVALGSLSLFHVSALNIGRFAANDPILVRVRLGPLQDIVPHGIFSEGLAAVAPVQSLNGRAVSGWVRLRVVRAPAQMFAGGSWEVLARLTSPHSAIFPGARDPAFSDRIMNITAEVRVESAAQAHPITDAAPTPLDRWRQVVRAALVRGAPDTLDLALLRSLVFGDADPRLRAVRTVFQQTGTVHHLAVSGTHLAFLSASLLGGLRALRMTRWGSHVTPRRAALLTLVVVLAYGMAVAPSPALIRSLFLASLITTGVLLGKRVLSPNLLGGCAVFMVALDPGMAFNAGFQLTFVVLLAILVVAPAVHAHLHACRDRDWAVVDAWVPHSRAARRRHRHRRCRDGAITAFVAFLAAAPLVSHHFAQLNPYTFLAGLLLEPFAYVALLAGLAKTTLSALLPWASSAFAAPALWASAALRLGVHVLALAPGTRVTTPSLASPLAAILLASLYVPLLIPRPRLRPLAWLASIALILGTPLVFPFLHPSHHGVRITFLPPPPNRPNAPTVVIESDGLAPILIDPPNDEFAFEDVLEPYLQNHSVDDLSAVLFTRPDEKAHRAPLTLLKSRYALPNALEPPFYIGDASIDLISAPRVPGDSSPVAYRLTYHGQSILLAESLDPSAAAMLSKTPWVLHSDAILAPKGTHPAIQTLIATANASKVLASRPYAAFEVDISPDGTMDCHLSR